MTDAATLSDADLSAAVAREVMGQNVEWINGHWHRVWPAGQGPGTPLVWPDGRETHAVPRYASDLGAAWRVVELLMSWHYEFQLESTIPFPEHPTRWWACFDAGGRNPQKDGFADTPARAICLAALHAVKDHGRNVAVMRAER